MTTPLQPDDRRNLGLRLSALQIVAAGAFALLAVAFWVFQVAQHQKFREIAENNHRRRLPLPAPRGVLFDRHGQVLVENQTTRIWPSCGSRRATSTKRCACWRGRPVRMKPGCVRRSTDGAGSRATVRSFSSRTPRSRKSLRTARASSSFPASSNRKSRRASTRGTNSGAHLFGYVSEVSEADLARAEYAGAEPGSMVGKAGVEQSYNRLLMGQDGDRLVVVNSRGREMLEASHRDPVEGRRVQLTIDADVQRATEQGFHHYGFNGAAVILDPRSGEVLALTSLPALRPERSSRAASSSRQWQELLTNPLKPLQNRALQGRYSPGSTFKIAVATAALEEGIVGPDFRVLCRGGGVFHGRFFKCRLAGGHGSVDMRHAIERSCNTYFYTLGNMLGVDRIHKWSALLGLGERSGIDLPNEVKGLVPSTEWKKTTSEPKWYPGETISVAIGQGQVSVTPLSLAVMMMAVANGGTRYTPHVVRAVDEGEGKGWQLGATASTAVEREDEAVDGRCAARGAVDGRERSRDRRTRPPRGVQRRRQDRNGAGHLADRAPRSRRTKWTCAITAGSCSSRRTASPRSPGPSSPSTPSTAIWVRRSRSSRWRPISQRKKAGRCRRLPPNRASTAIVAANQPDGVEPGRESAGRDGAAVTMFERRLILPRRLAAARSHADPDRPRRGDDLQHHLRPSARAGRPGAAVLHADLRHRPRPDAMFVCLVIDYRKLAENSLILLRRPDRAADLRALPGLDAVQRHALDCHRPVQPPAVGVRPHRRSR